MKILVVTVSDRSFNEEYEDKSGFEIVKILNEGLAEPYILKVIVPDNKNIIKSLFLNSLDFDFVITTGGTGISDDDITPEVTYEFCDKILPGIPEILRQQSYKETANAVLSRGTAGIKQKTVIINFPGSVKAVKLCTKIILPVMEHAIDMIAGKKHG